MSLMPWSTDTNYPAGADPWDATPTKADPNYQHFTPGIAVAAQEMNKVLNDRDVFALGLLSSVAQNWTQIDTRAVVFCPMAWDAYRSKWLLAYLAGGTTHLVTGTGQNTPLADYAGGPTIDLTLTNITSVCQVGHTILNKGLTIVAGLTAAGHVQVDLAVEGGAVVSRYTDSSQAWTDVKVAYFGGAIVLFVADSGTPASAGYIKSSTDQGVTWSSAYGVPAHAWRVAQGPGVLLGAAIATNGSTPEAVYTTDGVTFHTDPANWSGILVAPAVGVDVTWGADGDGPGFFFTYVQGGQTKFLRSADGINWVSVAGSGTAFDLMAVQAMGNLFVAETDDLAGNIRLIFSIDGCQTWWYTPMYVLTSGSLPTLASNGKNQFAFTDTGDNIWLSLVSGQAAQVV